MPGSMPHLTILSAAPNPGGSRSRMGCSKSLPKTSASPGMAVLGMKLKLMEYWSDLCGACEK